MALHRTRKPAAILTAMLIAAAAAALPAQPARVPASTLGPPVSPMAGHPYKTALSAVWNYQSCGVHARHAAVVEVTGRLRSIEAAAFARGLGPTLERLRRELDQLMAVSDMMACARGPVAALAGARRSLVDFQAWVVEQPAVPRQTP